MKEIVRNNNKDQEDEYIYRFCKHCSYGFTMVGSCVYFSLPDRKYRAKAYCVDTGVEIQIINPYIGLIDEIFIPFEEVFEPVQVSPDSALYYQNFTHNNWQFEGQSGYEHVLPKETDYKEMAAAIERYIKIYSC